ncbi:hypothetical protein CO174_03050 [Candidatus Uhrbacteria bacterium CG_4_9_14_3_um_filter_50_9]|uniref:Uncharacterized protein n=1 Tax=Candidatus Uhrbacteria bacterium CG_4_9_14_3_um_filter_50_9 TaxID=1975035 RepID=A0A2M7XCM3_9BACT|nr:MAG: hypothetical protein CO174_03050 [Candidatus Uhrbacteria bacterium CG_4_9_14_3_um_filter_50_9]
MSRDQLSHPEGAAEFQKPQKKEVGQEYHEGLPVVSLEDYKRLYNTDIREAGVDSAATFDFQGYVRVSQDGVEKLVYQDVLATNGIQRAGDHDGIHVGIDGIRDYSDLMGHWTMQDASEVGEYDVYITVPKALQQEQQIICYGDRCISLDEYREFYLMDGDETSDVYESQADKGWIVMRLDLEPKQDPLARKKVELVSMAIVKYLEEGSPIPELNELVYGLVSRLNEVTHEAQLVPSNFLEG